LHDDNSNDNLESFLLFKFLIIKSFVIFFVIPTGFEPVTY